MKPETNNSNELKVNIPDKGYMCLDKLLEYIKKEKAIAVSKSKIFMLTATAGGIPFRKVYKKLVFQ